MQRAINAILRRTNRSKGKNKMARNSAPFLCPYAFGKRVFLQLQRLNSPAMRGFIAQRPVE